MDELGRKVNRTSQLHFGVGPDADPAYKWDTKRKLLNLLEVCALPSAVVVAINMLCSGSDIWNLKQVILSYSNFCQFQWSPNLYLNELSRWCGVVWCGAVRCGCGGSSVVPFCRLLPCDV